MISKILKLQNVGLFLDATQGQAVPLARATAILADNGRGKSTLAAVLRACQLGDTARLKARKTIDVHNNPEVQLLLADGSRVEFTANAWNTTLPDIVVFDSEFVEMNVYSGFEVRADQRQSLLEFALGEQTVPLKRQIDQLTQDIETQTRRRTAAEKTLTGFASPYSVAQFIALKPLPDAQQRIDALQKRIEAAKNAQALVARKDPEVIPVIQFDVQEVFAILRATLPNIEAAAEAAVRAHLAKHKVPDFEDWISRGQQYVSGADCPFCGQPIGGIDLIQAYRSYFNTTYADLKRQIVKLQSEIERQLSDSRIEAVVSAANTNAARIEAWKDQLPITPPMIDREALMADLRRAREALLELVAAKQRAPLESMGSGEDAEAVQAALAKVNGAIGTYNTALQPVASEITGFKRKLSADNPTLISEEVERLKALQRRLLPEVRNVIGEYQSAGAERDRLITEKTKARQQLDTFMHETLQKYQRVINSLLTKLGAEFSIEALKPTYLGGGKPRTEYCICLRNKSVRLGSRSDLTTAPSFATTLSDGDKRTLAFVFFVARLRADPNVGSKIVVLDDPVSSLDRNRRHQSIRIIADLAGRCRQLLILSHDPYFIRELRDCLARQNSTRIDLKVISIKRVQNGYSAFASCDLDDVCSSDYYRHHRLVADYVDGKSTVNTRDVAKAIRPLLEGYYHRRFPGKIPKGLMFGHIIALAAKATAGDPLANLQPLVQEMAEINDYAGRFHHDTNPDCETAQVVDAELLSFAKKVLKLIYENG